MTRTRHSATAVGFGVAALLAMVVCPVMAGAAAAPISSSCHDGRDPGDQDGALDALTCCAAVSTAASLQPSDGAGAGATPRFAVVRPLVRPAAERVRAERPGPLDPPLFVQYSSLLI